MRSDILLAESDPEILRLDIKSHFESLTDREKLYAHWMSRAAYEGTRIILRQNSAESEQIFDLVVQIYKQCKGNWKELAGSVGVTTEDTTWFLEYASMFLANLGNYSSSSNKKFHPKISQAAFRALASYSPEATALFEASSEHIYSGESAVLGYPDEAEESYSGYYPETPVFPRDEISKVQDFLESQDIATENTRLRRLPQKQDGKTAYELLIASQDVGQGTSEDELLFTGERGDSILRLKHGDHEDSMRKINECLREAQKHTATEAQSRMLQHHIDGFQSGKIASHKEAQAAWVEDKNPQVESLLGFIEYYTDPHGVRAEWRGFVLLQNQHETKSLRELVSNADRFLRLLPWNKDGKSPFENERFESPDFTSMEALAFISTSIPVGTNAPNYADLRQEYGFKNLAIRNRLVDSPAGRVSFLSEEDSKLYSKLASTSFGILVALHELLGHGSGKHLSELTEGQFNFDRKAPPINPLTEEQVESWYKVGETFKSVFGWSYEECRCELVGLYLSFFPEVWQVFQGVAEGFDREDVVYIEFLYIVRSGVLGLASWSPGPNTWGSAYGRARFAIMVKLIQAGIARLEFHQKEVTVHLDRAKLFSEGPEAIKSLLLPMHVYLCTADREGLKMFESLSQVTEEMQKMRPWVLEKARKQKQVLQPTTVIEDGLVALHEYEATSAGVLQSWAERSL